MTPHGPSPMYVTAYCDGACSGNPGPGGWAVVLIHKNLRKKFVGGCDNTTNNQMELEAVYQAVLQLRLPCVLTVYTDSTNVVGWLMQNYKRKDPKIIEILDRIEALAKNKGVRLDVRHVRGHSGDLMNAECDKLAFDEAQRRKYGRGRSYQ